MFNKYLSISHRGKEIKYIVLKIFEIIVFFIWKIHLLNSPTPAEKMSFYPEKNTHYFSVCSPSTRENTMQNDLNSVKAFLYNFCPFHIDL